MAFELSVPDDLDHAAWIRRWDRMQEYYLVRRAERLAQLAWLVNTTQTSPELVLDLGCGTGSVMHALLMAVPDCRVLGVDLDPSMLILAEARLTAFSDRVSFLRADFRDPGWTDGLDRSVGAVLSATSLHWLGPDQIGSLYGQLAGLLRPGGLFANADHVAAGDAALQRGWEERREQMRLAARPDGAEGWDAFWRAYGAALGLPDVESYRKELVGEWRGVEAGMPLAWHFDALKASGFSVVECFWRCDCDAIYGALR
jgi:SAM-dependent methyltransferase